MGIFRTCLTVGLIHFSSKKLHGQPQQQICVCSKGLATLKSHSFTDLLAFFAEWISLTSVNQLHLSELGIISLLLTTKRRTLIINVTGLG